MAAGTVVTVSSTTPGATILWGTTNPPAVQRSTFTVSVPGTWYAQGTASGLTSSSVASAAYTISGTSPWLYVGPSSNPSKVTGPRILLNGVNYLGRGVNLNDIRNCGSCVNSSEASSLSVAESLMDAAVTTFGSNFIRLVTMCYTNGSYSENYACAGSDPTYLEDMVTLIQRAATHYSTPVYVMLSIWDDPTLSSEDWPTAATNTEWQVWVNALLTQPNVMFGLTNEPNGQGSSSDDAGAWSALNTAATTIRAVEDAAGTPHHIISSQGVDGYSRNVNYYVTHPITADGGGNIVYGIHAYDAASAFTTCTNSPYCWGEWEPQSLSIPVIIEEFGIASGYMTASDATTLMKDAQDLDVPYTAWDFNNNCAPDLINGSGCSASGITPTTWGTQVQTQLATPWSP